MIDKLELRIPSATEYTRAFGSLYVSLWSDSVNNPFRPSRHYAAVGDLRHFGYDVILHAHCKHGEAVFEGYASILEIMRIDFVAYKRLIVDFENVEQFVRMGQRDLETLYLGKRPNCYRIYNKIAELKK